MQLCYLSLLKGHCPVLVPLNWDLGRVSFFGYDNMWFQVWERVSYYLRGVFGRLKLR